MTTPKIPWYVRWYGNAPATPSSAQADAQFQALYPPAAWGTMTPAEQAQARAAWEGHQAVVAATLESGRRTSTALWVVFLVVPLFLAFVGGLVALLVAAGR